MAKYKNWWSAEARLNKFGFTHSEIKSLFRKLKSEFGVTCRFEFMIKLANIDDVTLVEYFDLI